MINRSTAQLLTCIDTLPAHWPNSWGTRGHKPSIIGKASDAKLFGIGRTTGRIMLSPAGKAALAEYNSKPVRR